MDQSALTRTSRLTATACDRERGFGGRERQSSRDGAGSPARRIPRVRANKRGGKTMRSRERPPARRKPERAPSWRRRTSSRPRTGGGRRWRRRWPASLTIRALSKVGDVCGYAPRRGSAKPLHAGDRCILTGASYRAELANANQRAPSATRGGRGGKKGALFAHYSKMQSAVEKPNPPGTVRARLASVFFHDCSSVRQSVRIRDSDVFRGARRDGRDSRSTFLCCVQRVFDLLARG